MQMSSKKITKLIREEGKDVFNQKLIYYDLKRYWKSVTIK